MGERLDTKARGGALGMLENHIVMWWKRKGRRHQQHLVNATLHVAATTSQMQRSQKVLSCQLHLQLRRNKIRHLANPHTKCNIPLPPSKIVFEVHFDVKDTRSNNIIEGIISVKFVTGPMSLASPY
jgi:hypothetical protein